MIVEREQVDAAGGEPLRRSSPRRRDCRSRGAGGSACRRQVAAAWPRSLRAASRALSPLRSPGSHDHVVPWNTVVMPLAMICRSLSISAISIGKSTPGRGIICRSKASPCRSTMPGSTSRPRASSSSVPRSALSPIADLAVLDRERCFENVAVEQGAAAFDENIGHDAALLLAGCEAREAASYLSRNSSIASLRKSGRARRSVS